MRKTFVAILALLLALSMLAGCTGNLNPLGTKAPGSAEKPATDDATSAPISVGGSGKLSDSFNKYLEVKGKAFDRLTKQMESNPDLAMMGLTMLPITMVDLTLIPMTVLSEDSTAAAMALGMLGMKDTKISIEGGVYSITYTDSEGKKSTQTCKYDKATDSVQSAITDESGKETLFFEYVRVGSGYAAQYYTTDETGTNVFTSFFDESKISAFGVQATDAKPASIFKNNSVTVDIVKGADTFAILDGDKLTIHDENGDKTY